MDGPCAFCRRASEAGTPGDDSCCALCGVGLRNDFASNGDPLSHTPLSLELTPDEPPWTSPPRVIGALAAVNIGRFQLRERLGGGGCGEVYRAFDPRLDREVALKVLRESHPSPRQMQRFFREARAVARLDHPAIVPVLDAGREDGRCWIAYRLISGITLERYRMQGGRGLPPREAVRIVRELAEALAHAHGRGVVHRDVKPSNILIDGDGRPHLIDFGLALRLEHEPTLTLEGAVMGTPAYMSPEQAEGRGHRADARTDLFSLGLVLHELLTGRRDATPSTDGAPSSFGSSIWPEGRMRIGRHRLPAPGGTMALRRICARALQHDREDRYPFARDMADDLGRWLRRHPQDRGWLLSATVMGLGGLLLGALGQELSGQAAISNPETTRATMWAPVQPPMPVPVDRVPADPASRMLHRPNCPFYVQAPNRLLLTRDQARAHDYRDCGYCLRADRAPEPEFRPSTRPGPDDPT